MPTFWEHQQYYLTQVEIPADILFGISTSVILNCSNVFTPSTARLILAFSGLKKHFESACYNSPTCLGPPIKYKTLHETIDILVSKSSCFFQVSHLRCIVTIIKTHSLQKSSIDMLSKGNLFSTIKEKKP